MGPVGFEFVGAGTGHGTAGDVIVPVAGRWLLPVQVRTDALTDYSATIDYQVR